MVNMKTTIVKFLIGVLAIVVLSLLGTEGVLAQDSNKPAVNQQKETLPGAQSYTRINANVACGGAVSLDALPELKRRGFVAVINLRDPNERGANVEAEGEAARSAGLTYINLPMNHTMPHDAEIVEAFLKAVTDPANQPVYIHSVQAHRVASVWLIKRVLVDGWSTERGLAEADVIAWSDNSRNSARARQFALDYIKDHAKKQ